MDKATNPLIQIISEKRMREVQAERHRTGKSFKRKSPKSNLRDLKKEERKWVVRKRVIIVDNSFSYETC